MKKILYFVAKAIAALLLAVFCVASIGYLLTPVYDFAPPLPFSGEAVYNPYSGVDFGQAKKAVFHSHTSRSDGRDSPEAVVAAYRSMGYRIVGVADHDRITPAGEDPSRELGTYEHGLNAYRFHNLVFGADRTCPFQLPLWQGVSGREHTLRRLSESFGIVVLNHPAGVRRLSRRQMQRLSHYDYIEADSSMDWGVPLWDEALSAGHYSRVMAADDLHDLSRPHAIGRAMTFVMTPGEGAADVTEALKAGHTYAVRVVRPSQNPDSLDIPRVRALNFAGDTLSVAFSAPASIRFVGQGGALRSEVSGEAALYSFAADDTYIRVEARFGDLAGGTTIYLNPLARYSPSGGAAVPVNASYATVNRPGSDLMLAAYSLLAAMALAGIFRLLFPLRMLGGRGTGRRPEFGLRPTAAVGRRWW